MRPSIWLLVLVLVACGGPQKDAAEARRARYDADLSVLLAETAAVLRKWYQNVEVDPNGVVRTAWTRYPPAKRREDDAYETGTAVGARDERFRTFVRFHVTISSPGPSRVEVTSHAAKQVVGSPTPTELRREDEPYWTRELEDRVQLEIHARLSRFAR